MASVLLGIDDRALGGSLARLLGTRGHKVAWVGSLDVTPGGGARSPDIVIVDGDAPGMELQVVAAAWRGIHPRPEMIVVAADPGTRAQAERLRATVVDAAPETIAAAVDQLTARGSEDDAAATIARARDTDVAVIRAALRPRMFDYIVATPLVRRLAARGALTAPEATVAGRLDGSRTVRSVVDAREIDPPTAARLVWALVQGGAALLSAEPPNTGARAAMTAIARKHVRARVERLQGANHYEVLEVPSDASPADVDQAARTLAFRYAPESAVLYDLGNLGPLVSVLWDQITAARNVLCDPRLRPGYDEAMRTRTATFDLGEEEAAEQAFLRGQKALATGDVALAASELARAARRRPDEPDYEAYAAWARVLAEVARGGDRAEAAARQRQLAEAAVWGRRPRPRALYAVALLQEAAGDVEAAKASLREALTADPQMVPAQKLYQRLAG